MMKNNKLYTVTKENKKPISESLYPKENVFWIGGNVAKWDRLASQYYGANYGDEGSTLDDYMNTSGNNWFGISRKNNPFSKGNIGNTAKVGAAAVGELGYNLLSDGYRVEGTAGNIMHAAQKFKTGDPRIDLIKDLAVGLGDRAFGIKVNQEALNTANAGTAALNNFTSNATNFDSVQGPQAVAAINDPYKGGWFRKKDARKKNEALKQARAEAVAFADRSVNNNIYNIAEDQLNDALANYSAFGGPIEQIYNDDMGAINYDFIDRYLTAKEAQNKQKNQLTNLFAGTPSTMFELGGVLRPVSKNYSVGKLYEVTEEEANRLKSMGYEFKVVG